MEARQEPKVTSLHERGITECALQDYEKEMERLLAEGVEVYSASYPGTRPIRRKRMEAKSCK